MGPYAHAQVVCEHLENRDEKDLASLYPEQCLALVDASNHRKTIHLLS